MSIPQNSASPTAAWQGVGWFEELRFSHGTPTTLNVESLEQTLRILTYNTSHLKINSNVKRGPARTVKVYETTEEVMKDFGIDPRCPCCGDTKACACAHPGSGY